MNNELLISNPANRKHLTWKVCVRACVRVCAPVVTASVNAVEVYNDMAGLQNVRSRSPCAPAESTNKDGLSMTQCPNTQQVDISLTWAFELLEDWSRMSGL